MFLQETYELEDCYLYDDASSNKTSRYTVGSALTFTWDTDHYNLSSSSTSQSEVKLFENISGNFELSALVYATGRNMGIGLFKDSNNYSSLYGVSGGTGIMNAVNGSGNATRTSGTLNTSIWYKFRLKLVGSTVTGIIETTDGTKFGEWTVTNNLGTSRASLINAWNYSAQYKNIKVKPL